MALGMFLLVVVAGAASAVFLIVGGSQAAVYAQIGIIPLLIVAGYLWVNRTVQASGTSRAEFERRKARQVGELFSDVWQMAQQIERTYPAGITEAEWDRLEHQMTDLEDNGISFDQSTGTFDVGTRNLGTLEDINRLETEVEDLDDWLLAQFTENIEHRVDEVNSTLTRLDSLVPKTTTVEPSSVPSAGQAHNDTSNSWEETGEALDDCYQKADAIIEEACAAIQEAVRSTDDAADTQIESKLSDARQTITAHEYDRAVSNILDARDMIERDAVSSFEDQQDKLQRLLRTAARKSFDQHLGPSHSRKIEEYQDDLDAFDDAIEIAELRTLRDQVRRTCIDIIDELEVELNRAVEELEAANVPEGWYERPTAVDTDHVRLLRETQDLSTFRNEFERVTNELLSVVDAIKPKASVVSGFDRIESEITETLRAQGVVTGADIPVSEQQEQFLGLYYRKHMDEVEFDPNEPKLTAIEGGEFYNVTVTAAFPEGGVERELIITLTGADTREEICYTPLVAETTFEDVPYGEYTVTVEAGEDPYSAVERTILVDDQTTVEVDLERISLREQLCQDIDIDVDEILGTLSARFMTRFDDEGYLSTDMSFPIDDEYIPCLVTVWAERHGHDATRFDSDVIVYDSEKIRKEIENVVRYNLEEGDSKSFDELRNNFLSAPVSNETIESLINESSEQNVLTVGDERLTKQEES